MDLSKNNSFLTEEVINFIARTEKKKEGTSLWNAWVLCVFVVFSHGNWKEAGVQLLYYLNLRCFVNKIMAFWYCAATKSFIIDDVGLRDPPLVFLFPVQNITKKIKI